MRQIVLDTETTGLEPSQGHRIIEIGCVEIIDRRLTGNHYHQYLQPDRKIDEGAMEVHGITNEFLEDKPRFVDIYAEFLSFIDGAELVIHNAPFDVGFINSELARLSNEHPALDHYCTVLDTLRMARERHPGQKNNLDALCKRYEVNNEHRELHGALLDAEILADVYLRMTGGQTDLTLDHLEVNPQPSGGTLAQRNLADRVPLLVIKATSDELEAHETRLDGIDKASGGQCVWRRSVPIED